MPPSEKISPKRIAVLRALLWNHGVGQAMKLLRTSQTMLDRILGSGLVTAKAAARLGSRIDELGSGL